jgi:opacity protein-like surface antigen
LANDVVAGGQVGCDYQAGEFVFGIQGMGDWTQMHGRFFDAVTGAFTESAQARWFATATGRIGYTITPPTLIYMKGGAAWVRNQYQDFFDFASPGAIPGCVGTGCNTLNTTTSTTQLGWTVGIGLEYMLSPNWSVFVEYNYMNFGNPSVNLPGLAGLTHGRSLNTSRQSSPVSIFGSISAGRRSLPDTDRAELTHVSGAKLMLLPRRGIADAFLTTDRLGQPRCRS